MGIACSLLTACELTEMPYTSVTDDELASNSNSVESVTLGNYASLKSLEFNKGVHQIGEYASDNILMSGQSTSSTFNTYNYQRVVTNSYTKDLWGVCYKTIVNCNKIISTSKEGLSNEMDHLIGENYFIRALMYHQLAITFGKMYHVATDADLAVPLKLTADKDDFPPRATVKKVYDQVVKDLKDAERLMINSGIEKDACYANLWAVKAYLSRVYLYMHDYKNAEIYATDVIEHSGKRLLTSNEYLTMNELVPENNPEALFAIRMLKDDLVELGDYSVIGSQYAIIDGRGYGEVYISQPLLDAFEKYPNDIRSTFIKPQYIIPGKGEEQQYEIVFISENYFYDNSLTPKRDPLHRQYYRFQAVKKTGDNTYVIDDKNIGIFEIDKNNFTVDDKGYIIGGIKARQTFKNKDGQKSEAEWVLYDKARIQKTMDKRNDYPRYYNIKCSLQEKYSHLWSPMVIRYSEMYMNRAEAYYYLNEPDNAINDLNEIKRRAMIPDYSEENDGELLVAIIDERRKEFYAEGQRKYDLLRNNMVIDRHYPGCHDRGSETSVVQEIRVTDNCAVHYIPQNEIDSYPIELPQNP